MLHLFNQQEFEGVVLFAAFELELGRRPFGEVLAQFGVGAGVFGLVPRLLDDFLDEDLADFLILVHIADDILLDFLEVFRDDEVEVVDNLFLALIDHIHALVLLLL